MTSRIGAFSQLVGRWFPLIVLIAGAIALSFPSFFAGLTSVVPWLLAVIMLGMGMTLEPRDFAYVARRPAAFAIGVVAHFVIMPLLAWLLTLVLPLSPELAVGVILVGCAPSGTSSNVMVFLAKGDTALSVAMSSVSTLVAPVVTPFLVLWLAGSYLPVDPAALIVEILQIVLIPVILGFTLRRVAGSVVAKALPVLPLISVIGITGVVVAVVSGSADKLLSVGPIVLLAVVLHNLLGVVLGYVAAKVVGIDEAARRAIALEVGMQNSGLAASLASTYFSPVAALPGALFSVWHNISGSLVATYWARRPVAVAGNQQSPTVSDEA